MHIVAHINPISRASLREQVILGFQWMLHGVDVASLAGCAGSHDFPHIAGAKQTKYINLYSLLRDKQEQEKGL